MLYQLSYFRKIILFFSGYLPNGSLPRLVSISFLGQGYALPTELLSQNYSPMERLKKYVHFTPRSIHGAKILFCFISAKYPKRKFMTIMPQFFPDRGDQPHRNDRADHYLYPTLQLRHHYALPAPQSRNGTGCCR